jgi:RNA polymerase sigma factor (sigma-70 family)
MIRTNFCIFPRNFARNFLSTLVKTRIREAQKNEIGANTSSWSCRPINRLNLWEASLLCCLLGLGQRRGLHGRTPIELLQYKACGWRTVAEIEQLIERAVSGEFAAVRIDESKAVAELLTLLEQAIAKLAPRDRRFLLARVRGMTFAEIGRRYGFTRARIHQVVVNALNTLRKAWGPRIPYLLEMMERHCFSISNGPGLTPALLKHWLGRAAKSLRLSREAQVRLIAALDKNIAIRIG